jgi:hypothetical protein
VNAHRFILARAAGAFFFACATVARASMGQTLPSDPAAERKLEQQQLERDAANLPVVKVESLDRVLKFSVEDNMLTVRALLGTVAGQQVRVVTPASRGVIRFNLVPLAGAADDDAQRNFMFIQHEIDDDGTERITQLSGTAGHLSLALGSESNAAMENVQLVQNSAGAAAAAAADPQDRDSAVTLYVQITDPTTGASNQNQKLSAPTFTELRRRHPGAVNRFLRPMIRKFGQEQAVFGSDERAQWQVLSADYQPDNATAAKVNAILKKFESENYQEREGALDELKKLGQPAAIVLARMDRSRLSPEQQSGVDTFLSPFLPLQPADVQRLRGNADFLLDCLYSDDAALRRLALARLESVIGRKPDFDSAAPADARITAIERLRQQLSPATAPATQP